MFLQQSFLWFSRKRGICGTSKNVFSLQGMGSVCAAVNRVKRSLLYRWDRRKNTTIHRREEERDKWLIVAETLCLWLHHSLGFGNACQHPRSKLDTSSQWREDVVVTWEGMRGWHAAVLLRNGRGWIEFKKSARREFQYEWEITSWLELKKELGSIPGEDGSHFICGTECKRRVTGQILAEILLKESYWDNV